MVLDHWIPLDPGTLSLLRTRTRSASPRTWSRIFEIEVFKFQLDQFKTLKISLKLRLNEIDSIDMFICYYVIT